jgi:tripartite-type tricarboxylate transporter receptor subunit TctC
MNKKVALIVGIVLLAVIIAVTGCPPPAGTVTPADFYRGKTIDLVVTHSAGGINDLTARIIASYLGESTGANVAVSNRKGASGLEGINYIYEAEPDGLTLGVSSSSVFVPNKVLGEPAATYQFEQFSYIYSIGRRLPYLLVSPDGPYQSVANLQAGTDLKIGASSPSGTICLGGLTIIKLLGLDAKVVTGFNKGTERALAVKRGEIVGYAESVAAEKASIEAGMVNPMFVLATERDPTNPDVPAITELVSLSSEDLALVRLWETALVGSTLFIAPPGIPEDRLAFLRDLANDWAQDEGFRAEIDTVYNYQVQEREYITGEDLTATMLETAATIDSFQAIFTELIEKYRA